MIPTHFNYQEYYDFILRAGTQVAPRGLPTMAVPNATVVFPWGLVPRRPKDNPAIGLMEGLQFIGGVFDRQAIANVAPNARLDLFGPQSAYGLAAQGQFTKILTELAQDLDSRRAVIVLDGGNVMAENKPCTTSLHFQRNLVYGDVLELTVSMRSSDAVWGLPYDLIQFSMVHWAVAFCLGLEPGAITLHLANAHVYLDRETGEFPAITWGPADKLNMTIFQSVKPQWSSLAERARSFVWDQTVSRKQLMELFLVPAAEVIS